MNERDDIEPTLLEIATVAMQSRGLEPEFGEEVLAELARINLPAEDDGVVDLTKLAWCSIDNDDSMDLDQITYAEKLSKGRFKIFVAVADVDALVPLGGAIDKHARKNTTSVYTSAKIFPMLPEKLSTNLTSLSPNEDRIAIVFEMFVSDFGQVEDAKIYRARVRNQTKLAYNAVAEWLVGTGVAPKAVQNMTGMSEQLKLQDYIAQKLRTRRHSQGALELETIEPRAVIEHGTIVDLKSEKLNRARELIEDFMVAANGATARYLSKLGYPTLRRVVRSPKNWDRIVEIAEELGEKLPAKPHSIALSEFLSRQRNADPVRFPDLSLTIIKLLGKGEYMLELPGGQPLGHFGLAVRDYSHSTAPNRRYPDLVTHRLLKSAFDQKPSPYSNRELASLAAHFTSQEDAAEKVERQVRKSAAALLLSTHIGEYFDAIVTGSSEKGTWARVFKPPVEGKIVHGNSQLLVGNRVRLKLINVNVEQGYIDFARVR